MKESRKARVLQVLDVLREYSDEEHRLSQKDIVDIMKKHYGTDIERRTVKSCILELIDAGYDIEYDEQTREKGTDSENTICTGFYLVRDFTDGELRFLIDSVLCSKNLPQNFGSEIAKKLAEMGTRHLRRSQRMQALYKNESDSDVLMCVEDIGTAISSGVKIRFMNNEWNENCELVPVWEKPCLFSPYRLAPVNNRYYLIGRNDGKNELSYYHLDLITDLELTDIPVEPNTFDVAELLASCPGMHGGDIADAEIIIKKDGIHSLIDYFGKSSFRIAEQFCENDTEFLRVKLRVGERDLYLWGCDNIDKAVVIAPPDVYREMVKNGFRTEFRDLEDVRYAEACTDINDDGGSVFFTDIDLRKRYLHRNVPNAYYAVFDNNNISDFSFLKTYTNAEKIVIYFNPVKNLDVLRGNEKLRSLTLRETEIDNIDFLRDIKNLRELFLSSCNVKDFSVLFECKNLRKLILAKEETKDFDFDRLKRENPSLRIVTEDWDSPVMNIESVNTKDMVCLQPKNVSVWPVNLYRKINNDMRISDDMKDNADFCRVADELCRDLGKVKGRIVQLHFRDGKTPEEIGKELHVSPDYVLYVIEHTKFYARPGYCDSYEEFRAFGTPINPDFETDERRVPFMRWY